MRRLEGPPVVAAHPPGVDHVPVSMALSDLRVEKRRSHLSVPRGEALIDALSWAPRSGPKWPPLFLDRRLPRGRGLDREAPSGAAGGDLLPGLGGHAQCGVQQPAEWCPRPPGASAGRVLLRAIGAAELAPIGAILCDAKPAGRDGDWKNSSDKLDPANPPLKENKPEWPDWRRDIPPDILGSVPKDGGGGPFEVPDWIIRRILERIRSRGFPPGSPGMPDPASIAKKGVRTLLEGLIEEWLEVLSDFKRDPGVRGPALSKQRFLRLGMDLLSELLLAAIGLGPGKDAPSVLAPSELDRLWFLLTRVLSCKMKWPEFLLALWDLVIPQEITTLEGRTQYTDAQKSLLRRLAELLMSLWSLAYWEYKDEARRVAKQDPRTPSDWRSDPFKIAEDDPGREIPRAWPPPKRPGELDSPTRKPEPKRYWDDDLESAFRRWKEQQDLAKQKAEDGRKKKVRRR